METCESTNNIGASIEKENGSFILKIKTNNHNQSNIINNKPSPLKLNILSSNNLVNPPKPIKLVIINEINYEDNILFFNSIINEAKLFLDSVP